MVAQILDKKVLLVSTKLALNKPYRVLPKQKSYGQFYF